MDGGGNLSDQNDDDVRADERKEAMGLRKNLKNMASSFVVEKNTSLRFGINSPDKK